MTVQLCTEPARRNPGMGTWDERRSAGRMGIMNVRCVPVNDAICIPPAGGIARRRSHRGLVVALDDSPFHSEGAVYRRHLFGKQ